MRLEEKALLYDVRASCELIEVVWGIVQARVPALRDTVVALLEES